MSRVGSIGKDGRHYVTVSDPSDHINMMYDLATRCGAWLDCGGSKHGRSAEVWDDPEGKLVYVFRDDAYIVWMHAVKDATRAHLDDAIEALQYVYDARTTQPSVFVRDACAAKAEAVLRSLGRLP